MMSAIKNNLKKIDWLYFVVFYFRNRALFRADAGYDAFKIRLIAKVRQYTMVPIEGLKSLIDLCDAVEKSRIPGAFVECGVWNGGCSALMASVSKKYNSRRPLYLFDSFEGIPEPTTADGSRAHDFVGGKSSGQLQTTGRLVGTVEVVRYLYGKLRIDMSTVRIVKGWFQDTLPATKKQIGPIAVLRLDGDWYESTKVCLENLYDLVTPGGTIIVDDYGCWEGCKKAVDEFFQARGARPEMTNVNGEIYFFRKSS